jgi:1-deoxy-D-xylulose-5-phosphate reductoisomerase
LTEPRFITVLGATGSIGQSTLDVVLRHPDRYRVFALTADRNVEGLAAQCRVHRPRYAVMVDATAGAALAAQLQGSATEVLTGPEALVAVAEAAEVHAVMAAIVGAAGLLPSLAAARAGKRVLLANKEALVMSGRLFMDAVAASGALLLPIDSEHNAVFQCLPPGFARGLTQVGVTRITLTASGGPFRNTPVSALDAVTPAEAVAHPNWRMGRKISVDSATMMNKGLEFIEACWLFSARAEQVEVVIHPQSIIHSLVSYADGSTLAQLGHPDMRTPIAHALAWPERLASGVELLDLVTVGRLDFEPPDLSRFPCLALARAAWGAGGAATAVLNAANEVAVDAFLAGALGFTGIARLVEATLARCGHLPADGMESILAADAEARQRAREWLARKAA